MRLILLILVAVILTACGSPVAPQAKQGCTDTTWVPSNPDGWVRSVVTCSKI